MGYIIDKYLIVSGWKDEHLNIAHEQAKSLFDILVTPIFPHRCNGSSSFFINTSGSKSGWIADKEHDKKIEEFIEWSIEKNLYNKVLVIEVPEESGNARVVEEVVYIERMTTEAQEER